MLRDVVGNYLDTLSEREFDGPLLALLSARKFSDVHFIHGAFEFGKDVVAKRADPTTGEVRQYVIQSKAGDIGVPEWRAVRSQLEECEYNTLGHPSFDATLPRVVVLVTTGRLKGGAPADVSEYRRSVAVRDLADLEIWDKSDIIDWICADPLIGVAGDPTRSTALMSMLTNVLDNGVSERRLEKNTRSWLPSEGGDVRRASIEAAILINGLLRVRRLDLALSVGLQLVRSAAAEPQALPQFDKAALTLVLDLATRILDQVEPLFGDPLAIARRTIARLGQLTYPVICNRLAEAIAIGFLIASASNHDVLASRFRGALIELAEQPGASRPPSDLFGASVLLVGVALSAIDRPAAVRYLRRVAQWVLDRHDDDLAGLGLASLSEDEQATAERLFGGSLESTTVERRTSSYLATVVLDLTLVLDDQALYEALLDNFRALRIVAETTNADEVTAHWVRGGAVVWPVPNVQFEQWYAQSTKAETLSVEPLLAMLLTAACRSRHYRSTWSAVTALAEGPVNPRARTSG